MFTKRIKPAGVSRQDSPEFVVSSTQRFSPFSPFSRSVVFAWIIWAQHHRRGRRGQATVSARGRRRRQMLLACHSPRFAMWADGRSRRRPSMTTLIRHAPPPTQRVGTLDGCFRVDLFWLAILCLQNCCFFDAEVFFSHSFSRSVVYCVPPSTPAPRNPPARPSSVMYCVFGAYLTLRC